MLTSIKRTLVAQMEVKTTHGYVLFFFFSPAISLSFDKGYICKTYLSLPYMKIEEAILYCIASRNGGMRTEQIAEMINAGKLHVRRDGKPVTSEQVYAVVMHNPSTFCKAEGRIMLMIRRMQ